MSHEQGFQDEKKTEELRAPSTLFGGLPRRFLPRERVDRILVPVDFSSGSRLAMERAISIARLYGASIWLLHVVDLARYVGIGVLPGGLQEIVMGNEEAMKEFASSVVGQRIECTSLLWNGALADQISQAIAECNIDLLVLATHAGTGLQGYAMGATAERILRRTVIPVVTVSTCRPLKEWEATGPSHVLYATDLSDISLRSLAYACSVRNRFSAKLTVVHVPAGRDRPERIRTAVNRLSGLGLADAKTRVLFGPVGTTICSAAVKFGADLVAVGVEKRNALGEFLFGHTLLEILAGAPCPVLSIRQWK